MRTLSFVAHPIWKHWLVPDACILLVVMVPVELPREVLAVVMELVGNGGGSRAPVRCSGSGPRFSIVEMEATMDAIEEILPVGPDEWEQVVETHATSYPELQRDRSSLRRKFAALYNTKMPKGDPKCPSHVRHAKRANICIEERYDSMNVKWRNPLSGH
jgi:hypothetical protein